MLNDMDIYASGAVLMPMSVGSREDFEAMNKAISHAKRRPLISKTFTFDDTVAAAVNRYIKIWRLHELFYCRYNHKNWNQYCSLF